MSRCFRRILIANNGLAALKALKSLKNAFPRTSFAVVATDDDVTGNAEYLKLADLMVELPKGPNVHNFASVARVVDVAAHSRCDALWPGWGHASENCELPLLLSREQPGITWIGPAAEPMRLLGDKIRSTIVAQSMGVPCVAWSGRDVSISGCAPNEEDVRRACIHCPAEAVACADDVGYPCIIKASAGGGGRGIRKVLCRAQAAGAYRQVVAELPNSDVFCMRLMVNCKHVEVQVLGDNFSHVIAVGTRDCSVQRRCQKIIEEGPAIAVPARTLAKMEQDAIRLCSAVGYTNAGTVEFLFDMASDCYYFLEVNSRLQVEHTVTEGAYSVNLTAAQVKIALGYRLVEIDDVNDMLIRRNTASEENSTPANLEAHAVPHVISARITSEDNTFRPTTGPVFEVSFSPMNDVWGYFSVKSQGRIQQHMDSQFGHVFSRGPTREVARQRLAEGLQGLVVQGAISYNRDVLLKILSSKTFKDNAVHTTWLEESLTPPADPRDFRLPVAAALYKSHQAFQLSAENFTTKVSQGQLPPTLLLACVTGFQDGEERYRFQCFSVGPDLILLEVNGTCSTFEFRSVGLDMCYCIRRLDTYERFEACIHAGPEGVIQVEVRSMTRTFTENVDPRKIVSPMDGNLVRWLIRDGDRGEKHQPFAEIEVMKMYVELPLQHSGKVRHMVLEGSIFPANALLGVLELDEDDIVAPLPLTCEVLEESTPTVETPHDLVVENTRSRAHLMSLLSGYCDLPTEHLEAAVGRFFTASTDLRLPFVCLRELLQECGLHDKAVSEIIDRGWKEFSTDGVELKEPLHGELLVSLTEKLDPLLDTVKDPMLTDRFYDILRHYGQHYSTTRSVVVDAVVEVLSAFLNGQLSLPHSDYVRCCLVLRSTKNPNELLDLARMSQQTSHRKRIVMCVLQRLASSEWRQLIPFLTAPLKDLSRLNDPNLHSVAVMAQQLLLTKQPRLPFQSTMAEIRLALSRLPLGSRSFLCLSPHHGTPASTVDRVQSTLKNAPIECLFELLCGESLPTALRACEAFVQRHYAGLAPSAVAPVTHLSASVTLAVSWSHDLIQFFEARSSQVTQTERPKSISQRFDKMIIGFREVSVPRQKTLLLAYGSAAEFSLDHLGAFDLALVCVQSSDDVSALIDHLNESISHVACQAVTVAWLESSTEMPQLRFYTSTRSSLSDLIQWVAPWRVPLLELSRMVENTSSPESGDATSLTRLPSSDRGVYVFTQGVEPRYFWKAFSDYDDGIEQLLNDVLNTMEIGSDQDAAWTPRWQVPQTGGAGSASSPQCARAHSSRTIQITVWTARVTQSQVEAEVTDCIPRFGLRFSRLGVDSVEVRVLFSSDCSVPVRLYYTTLTEARVTKCLEMTNPITGEPVKPPSGPDEALTARLMKAKQELSFHIEVPARGPRADLSAVDLKRGVAKGLGTTYVYDFVSLFENAVMALWQTQLAALGTDESSVASLIPAGCFYWTELVLAASGDLTEVRREPGLNSVGMVGFKLVVKTPEAPDGRALVVVANDITFQGGSFGLKEDHLFAEVSRYARSRGIPRVFIAANSGARLGLADEILAKVQIAWFDPQVPQRGFKYLFLTDDDFQSLKQPDSVQSTEYLDPERGLCHRLTCVIGAKHGIGVENLAGSACIAASMVKDYRAGFLLTFVSGRSVGIGAYLARLGQRVIQKTSGAPILLTGYQALNRVCGRDAYTSNDQLGGVDVMSRNGVAHLVVDTDLDGCLQALRWLSFVPAYVGGPLPVYACLHDIPSRPVRYYPSSNSSDPRLLLTGGLDADGAWLGGLLDRGSFMETMAHWATSAIAGRGRLGGIPVGIITSETRITTTTTPADPALDDTTEREARRAGQVLYPDSAQKVAQAIRDFEKEELPLIVLANWRGFSGGLTDMYGEVLKHGSDIVGALVDYKQPVFIYIPAKSELRGGAWVVFDSRLNPDVMEMYSDETGRGGILESNGLVEIKCKRKTLEAMISRLDTGCKELREALERPGLTCAEKEDLRKSWSVRLEELLPVYKQAATAFVDLHDTPHRMLAKKVIRRQVPWVTSREFFFWRLKRQLLFFTLRRSVQSRQPEMTTAEAGREVLSWFPEVRGQADSDFVRWASSQTNAIYAHLEALSGSYAPSSLTGNDSPCIFKLK